MRSVAVAAFGLTLAGCVGWRYQAGLANAPALNRPFDDADFAHDAIANGDESCPASGRAEDDRLFRRWPTCGGTIVPARVAPPPRPQTRRARPGPLALEHAEEVVVEPP
jgi:hypothetical protein